MSSHKLLTENLSNLHRDTLLNEVALAELLEVHPKTIKRMVQKEQLPPHFKLGGYSCWLVGNLINHFYERAKNPHNSSPVSKKKLILKNYLP